MTPFPRAVRLLGPIVPRDGRPRFVEEWSGILLELGPCAARWRLLVTMARVAAYLRIAQLRRRRSGRHALSLVLQGVLVGLVLTATDVPVGFGIVLVLVVDPRLRVSLRPARA